MSLIPEMGTSDGNIQQMSVCPNGQVEFCKSSQTSSILVTLSKLIRKIGRVWLNATVLKTACRDERYEGSNPSSSAGFILETML